MSSACSIRRATPDDALQLKEIRLLALRDEPDAYGSTFEESARYSDEQWSRMAGEWSYFLAFCDDLVVGMASGGLFPPHPQARWLYGMFVRREYRGTGVADALVDAVVQWARDQGVQTLGLHVTTSLARPTAFYSRLGFVAFGSPTPMDRDATLSLQTMRKELGDVGAH